MKEVEFLGSSLEAIQAFPKLARRKAGFELQKLQAGRMPEDWKPMPSVGPGVEELRIWDATGTYRVIYFARRNDAIYVLDAFQKKTETTSKRHIEIARKRLRYLIHLEVKHEKR